jgi:ornithine decarboxylase
MAEVALTSPRPAVPPEAGNALPSPGTANAAKPNSSSRPCSASALRAASSPVLLNNNNAGGTAGDATRLEALCGDWLASLNVSSSAAATAPPAPPAPAPSKPPQKPTYHPWHLRAAHNNPAAASVLASVNCEHLSHGGVTALSNHASRLIARHRLDDTAYVYDLGNPLRLWRAWRRALPRVHPFYAVKCNPEPAVLRLLASLGAGFDCASKAELEAVLNLGVPRDRIIFAHPCKRASDLRFARDAGVELTTFDTASELHKIAAAYPSVDLVLRVRADDPDARVPLGLKYGADPQEAAALLSLAKTLNLNVVGCSFHVGSACRNLAAFEGAIATARKVFDAGEAEGFSMKLLDLGGGFTGRFDKGGNVVFGDIAGAINAALARHFPIDESSGEGCTSGGGAGCGVRVISEPGRYFAETSAALLTPVYGTRDRAVVVSGGAAGEGGSSSSSTTTITKKDYWLTDGLYGSFNCILYDDQKPTAHVLRSPLLPAVISEAPPSSSSPTNPTEKNEEETLYPSTLWGPTCDSADFVYKDLMLPALRNGDWVLWPNAGAYTVAGACDFNGIEFTCPRKFYVCTDSAVDAEDDGEEGGFEEAKA